MTCTLYCESSSGICISEVSNSMSQQSPQELWQWQALNTNFEHDSHEKALRTEATSPIYSKTSTTVSWIEIIFSNCAQIVARRGTSVVVFGVPTTGATEPMPWTFRKMVCPVLRFSPEAITMGSFSMSTPMAKQSDL